MITTKTSIVPVFGVGVMFASNGAVFASLLPRYPLTRDRLDVTATEFGHPVLGSMHALWSLGAVAGGGAATLTARRESLREAGDSSQTREVSLTPTIR